MNAPALVVVAMPPRSELVLRRPRHRGDCLDGPRPCPWVGCVHHGLHARLLSSEGHKLTDDEAIELLADGLPSCTLDVADRGGVHLEEVGDLFGCTREWIRQIEATALRKIRAGDSHRHLDVFLSEEPDADDARRARAEGGRGGRAAFHEDERAPRPAPTQHAHLPGPDGVGPGETFWCGWINAAVSTGLCVRRQTMMSRPSATARPAPAFPVCARCADGKALRERIGTSPPAASIARIDFFGDGAETPFDDETTTETTDEVSVETPSLKRIPNKPASVLTPAPAPFELAPGVTVEVIDVTPAMAEAWLSTRSDNRSISDTLVAKYAADMKAGAWVLTHQGIALDPKGKLIDGEHRLWAVVQAGCTVRMMVTRGLTAADREAFDQGRARSTADALRIAGDKQARAVVSWFRVIATLKARTAVSVSPAMVRAELARYAPTLAWARASIPKTRPLNRAPVAAAFVYAHRVCPEQVAAFVAGYASGAGLAEDSPILALRGYVLERVQREHEQERRIALRALRAVLAHIKGEALVQLKETDEAFEHFRKMHDALDAKEVSQ